MGNDVNSLNANKIIGVGVVTGGTVIQNIYNENESYTVPSQLTKTIGSTRNFIGRTKELKDIETQLKNNNSLLLINGIGGIGKSSLAMEFLQKHKKEYNHYGFVTVLGDIKSVLFNQLHVELRLKEYDKIDDNFHEVLRKLRILEGEKLLVIDDVRDIEQQREAIEAVLGLRDSGYRILFTSREEIEGIENYYLDVLSLEDAKSLFKSIYPTDNDIVLEEILGYLDNYTFFVEKVASTLKLRKNSLSIENIKEKFQNGEFSKIGIKTQKSKKEKEQNIGKLLDELFTFDDLDDEDILLLKQLSILPSIEISYNLLEKFFNKQGDEDFGDLLNFLVSKGWLSYNSNSYKLHQIIREYIWEKHTPKVEEIDSIVLFFAKMIEGNDIRTAKLLQGYMVYFEEIIYVLGRLGVKFNEKIVEFFDNIGFVYYYLGEYKKAEPFWYKVMKVNEEIFGENHKNTATSYNNLALLYKLMGQFERAEPLYQKSLAIREKLLGEEHLDTAISYHNLALFYYDTDMEMAYEYIKKATVTRERVLPKNHPDLIASKEWLKKIQQKRKEKK